MARAKYIPGALVEARNTINGNGFGMIVSGPTLDTKAASRYRDLESQQEWFKVHWFEKPGNVDRWSFRRNDGQINMTKNQIILLRKR